MASVVIWLSGWQKKKRRASRMIWMLRYHSWHVYFHFIIRKSAFSKPESFITLHVFASSSSSSLTTDHTWISLCVKFYFPFSAWISIDEGRGTPPTTPTDDGASGKFAFVLMNIDYNNELGPMRACEQNSLLSQYLHNQQENKHCGKFSEMISSRWTWINQRCLLVDLKREPRPWAR